MTDLESPRKNNDCYFYYYSTCTKGDNCTFRHEPSALGCETTCSFWKEGKCINVHCNFRHMELRKNRKTIPCYWESQPSGCKKPHCPFMHISKKDGEGEDEVMNDEHDDVCNLKIKKDDFTTPVVDPIVVNFEEESDNESTAPTQSSPHKTIIQLHSYHLQAPHDHYEEPDDHLVDFLKKTKEDESVTKAVEVKTLEEIKLDRIQAESAAYYSYSDEISIQTESKENSNGRNRNVFKRLQPLEVLHNQDKTKVNIEKIQVLTLDEIRKRKRKMNFHEQTALPDSQNIMESKRFKDEIDPKPEEIIPSQPQLRKFVLNKTKPNKNIDLGEIKIKTLAEIKAERQLKRKLAEASASPESEDQFISNKKHKVCLAEVAHLDSTRDKEQDEQIVSSTSKNDEQAQISAHIAVEQMPKVQCIVAPLKRQLEITDIVSPTENNDVKQPNLPRKHDDQDLSDVIADSDTIHNESVSDINITEETKTVNDVFVCNKEDDSKLDELLLDDDEDDIEAGTLTLKAEDDILNDIDNLLNE